MAEQLESQQQLIPVAITKDEKEACSSADASDCWHMETEYDTVSVAGDAVFWKKRAEDEEAFRKKIEAGHVARHAANLLKVSHCTVGLPL